MIRKYMQQFGRYRSVFVAAGLVALAAWMVSYMGWGRSRPAGLPLDASRLSAYTAVYAADNEQGGTLSLELSQSAEGSWLVTSALAAQNAKMSSQVSLRTDFTPATSHVTLDADGKHYEINSEYREKTVLISAQTPDGPQQIERNLSRPYYDNEQLVPMLPALQLTLAKKTKFVLVATQTGTKLTPNVYLATDPGGKAVVESVSIPSGKVDCQVLKLNIGLGGAPEQTFWVTTTAPYVVAKINNGKMNYLLRELKP